MGVNLFKQENFGHIQGLGLRREGREGLLLLLMLQLLSGRTGGYRRTTGGRA